MRLSVIVFKELGSVRNSIKNAVKPRAAGALPKGMPSVLPQKHANLENAGSVSIKVREQHNIAALMDSLIGTCPHGLFRFVGMCMSTWRVTWSVGWILPCKTLNDDVFSLFIFWGVSSKTPN